ncbi:NAD(P)/FAD-dependent oxidoreductase [Paenirhodobacter populi]|uniref:NAD(P)/FAD-dependent oxidoreductase n=1 Tax=Paenirhodobacter populi TaxID=2306993 RepID=UPI000FE3BED7|nr:FAD-dependent oxidoreductase [Sinirhodobacter populi]RWR04751.1 FAD-binding oxidoreductase [Sinirhodobacter populi]
MSFVISLADRVVYPGPPPAQADAVVIGGGVAGIMTAYFLAKAGQRVVLCEKGRVAGEQSSRNWGWIRQQGRDPAELPITMEAVRLWEGFAAQLGPELGFNRCGVTYLSDRPEAVAGYENWVRIAAEHGLESRVLTKSQIAGMIPNSANWACGLITPSDGRAEPWVAVKMLAHLAVGAGVEIIENCAVRALDLEGGRLTGVVTEMGRIKTPQVLLAGGAWSSLFARAQGVDLPQLSVRASVAQTVPLPENVLGPSGVDDDFAWRRRLDGGYTLAPGAEHDLFIGPDAFRHFRFYIPQMRRDLSKTALRPRAPEPGYPDGWTTPRHWDADQPGPFEAMRILDPQPNMKYMESVRQAFAQAFPQIGLPKLQRSWAGMIDVMPDTVPVLDETAIGGFFVATGLSGHGFGIGPGIGRVMADLMLGRAPGHDLRRFRLSRFTDGSKMELGPTF